MTEILERPMTRPEPDEPQLETLEGAMGAAVSGPNAIEKALALLGALGTGRAAEPLSGLATKTSMPKSTVCRILKTMESQGFVARKGQLYCLGPRVSELGRQADLSTHNDLRTMSLSVLERLFADVRSTVHLAVPSGAEVLILEKITAPGAGRIPTRVAGTLPAACTAVGKALLAYAEERDVHNAMAAITPAPTPRSARSPRELATRLADVRRNGFALDQEEFRPGVTCVAAPVLVGGRAVAAISASTMLGARSDQRAPAVIGAARRLAALLERSAAYAE